MVSEAEHEQRRGQGEGDRRLALAPWVAGAQALRLRSIEIDAQVTRPLQLGSPACAVLRGLLGERLRDLRCLTRAPSCEGCTERARCDYARVMEAGAAQRNGRTGAGEAGATPPLWLQGMSAGEELAAGERLTARLVFGGDAAPVLPYLDVALRDALGRLGLSPIVRGPGPLALSATRLGDPGWPESGAGAGARGWRIRTRTPLLLRADPARLAIDCPASPFLALLLRAGVRRLALLREGLGAERALPRALFPDLRGVRRRSGAMQAWSGSRYSRRQGQRMPLEGISGEVELEGDALAEMAPLLAVLPLVSVGKMTALGFGWIEAEPLG